MRRPGKARISIRGLRGLRSLVWEAGKLRPRTLNEGLRGAYTPERVLSLVPSSNPFLDLLRRLGK